ncbi:hypothetical protein WH50_13380 [Pokkaliibacter plantistimulans]|uniref:DUF1887 domain-containing protein n=1 Tax=Pokkaliibacter plantistimulans TaxID=1635171 RepID=A0ABX5LXI3_9GAMM|nr:hypothetical protein WH50_13380 [Pokkaliibacter plantistimulans]
MSYAPDIHLCLMSDQATPNLTPLLEKGIAPVAVTFVVTPQQKHRLDYFQEVLRPRNIKVEMLELDSAYDHDAMTALLDGWLAVQKKAGKSVWFNLTGGTKPMSIAAHLVAFNADIPAFYISDNRLLWMNAKPVSDDMLPAELASKLSFVTFLTAHGIKVEGTQSIDSPVPWRELIRELCRLHSTYHKVIPFLNRLAAMAKPGLTARIDAVLTVDHEQLLKVFEQAGLLSWTRESVTFPDEDARFFCNGGWLEHHLMQTVRSSGAVQDMAMSMEVSYVRPKVRKTVKNEIDVAVLANNTLHLIECKTKRFGGNAQDPDSDLSSALYKLATLRKELGGLRCKAMLVSYGPVEEFQKERARVLDIELCQGDDMMRLDEKLKSWIWPSR